MKPANARLFSPLYTAILLAAAAMLAVAIACSTATKAKPIAVMPSQPIGPMVRPTAPKSVAFTGSPEVVTVPDKSGSTLKTSKTQPKYITFKSRDYGVSFEYPWQYTKLSPKTIAADDSLQPQSDGLDSQVTLARVEVPKGFYPGTDLDSGYFMLSLNPDLSDEQCKSTLKLEKDAKPQMVNINGVDYLWSETESGGKGSAAKVRNYVAYANDTCYEVETGVKTTNDGLSREIDPDQVLRRLDSILMSVQIGPEGQSKAKQQLQSAKDALSAGAGK
jgi:hypothetical protein